MFGSQHHHYFPPDGQPNPSFPTVEISDVPAHRRSHMNVGQAELHSLDLSLISNQQMSHLASKMRLKESNAYMQSEPNDVHPK